MDISIRLPNIHNDNQILKIYFLEEFNTTVWFPVPSKSQQAW